MVGKVVLPNILYSMYTVDVDLLELYDTLSGWNKINQWSNGVISHLIIAATCPRTGFNIIKTNSLPMKHVGLEDDPLLFKMFQEDHYFTVKS